MSYSYNKIPVYYILLLALPIYLFYNGIKYLYWFLNNDYIIKYQAFLWGVFNIVCGVFIAILIAGKYFVLHALNKKYLNGEYQKIDGEIQNLIIGYLDKFENDKFVVNNVNFEIGFLFKPGLQKTAALGGPIQSDNQKVSIIYIDFDNYNYILNVVTTKEEQVGEQDADDSISSWI